MEVCKICSREFDSIRKLSRHLRDSHRVSLEEYDVKYNSLAPPVCLIDGCENTTTWVGYGLGFTKFCFHCSKNNRSEIARLNRLALKQDDVRFNAFREKVSNNMVNFHRTMSDEYRDNRLSNISVGLKRSIEQLSPEERKIRYGWMNKLTPNEKKEFIETVTKQTGMFLWYECVSSEHLREMYDRRAKTLSKTWEERGKDIMRKQTETFLKNRESLNNDCYWSDGDIENMTERLYEVFGCG